MPQLSNHLRAPALALIALTLFPPLAKAQPHREAVRSPVEHTAAAPSLFAEIRAFLSILWAENGSGLEPNGRSSAASAEPNAATTGDNGSVLEPDGRH
jgi:hypothetical protein